MIDEPNLVLPLATTVNERGMAGFTHSVTNVEDQRKLNVIYEVSKNNMTGKGTMTLVKRPGVTISSSDYGSSSQIAYLVLETDVTTPPARVVFNTLSGNVRSSVDLHDVTIVASATNYPMYCDTTVISGTRYAIVQIGSLTGNSDSSTSTYYASISDLLAGSAWTQLTDGDYTTGSHVGKMEHMDGYAFIFHTDNKILSSDVNSIANWTATSFISKGIQMDSPVGLARLNLKLLAFGQESVEIFYNAGNTTGSPLGRIPNLATNIGLVPTVRNATSGAVGGGTDYYATLDNRIYFVGSKSGVSANSISNNCGLYFFDGQAFDKISMNYIDKILSEESSNNSIYSINTISFQGQAGIAICFSVPTAATQRFLVFCPEWKEWFEWTSTVFSPVNDGGYHIGISTTNKLFNFATSDNWQDNGTSYQWFTQFKLPTKGSNRNVLNMYGVDADTARSANDLTVEISRDDCQTFQTLNTIDLTQERKVAFRGGVFRNAHIRLGNTNAVETRIHNFVARVN